MRALLIFVVACGSTTPPPAPSPTRPPDVLMSDQADYAIDRITRSAGQAIFERTGIGDPYRTGVPYPLLRALIATFPQRFGATTTELAEEFGLVSRLGHPFLAELGADAPAVIEYLKTL